MALADTTRAIGAVTKLLVDHLVRRSQPMITHVTVGRPEQAVGGANNPKFNLFLYELHFDGSMRNISLQDGQPPPLWLTLKYLLTAFDEGGDSDTSAAHEILGLGLSALQEINYLRLDALVAADVQQALAENPEPLKITFEESSPDLLGRIMQGTDEKYRISAGFQIRPILIAPAQPPSFSLLVGINYTTTPLTVIGGAGIDIEALPSLGPLPTAASPEKIQIGDRFEITGENLGLANLQATLGNAPISIVAQRDTQLACRVDNSLGTGTIISAGALPLTLRQNLPNGRFRAGPPIIITLLPTLTTVAPGALNIAGGKASGTINLTGLLLGTANDDILVSLYQNGAVLGPFDIVATSINQKTLTLTIPLERAVPIGDYQLILRVNNAQAKNALKISLI